MKSKLIKRFLQLALILTFLPNASFANGFNCRVLNGVYKPPGTARLDDALKRDTSINGQNFYIKRETGVIGGSSIFANINEEIRILSDIKGTINSYVVTSVSKHSDAKILKIDEFDGKLTFIYYFSWLGLFLTGECHEE